MKVAMIGLGKLGLPCAEAMAKHHDVKGYDRNPAICSRLVKTFPTLREAISETEMVFIAVPTPHDGKYDGQSPTSHLKNKDFDYTALESTLVEISRLNYSGLVVIISTVLPGTIRRLLEAIKSKLRVLYNPYFIAMGTVQEDFLKPEMIPIGSHDGSTINKDCIYLQNFYRGLIAEPRFEIGTFEEIECVKIFYNTFISFKIGFVNMIQDIAMRIGNTNVDVVTQALASSDYRLMSPMYLKAGLGDGGPCHPRDNIALSYLAENLGLGYDLFKSIMTAREVQAKNLAQFLLTFGNDILIAGLSFKPEVPLQDGSYISLIAHYLREVNANFAIYDPSLNMNLSMPKGKTWTVLLAHTKLYNDLRVIIGPHSIVVDPWRTHISDSEFKTVAYGNTRGPL